MICQPCRKGASNARKILDMGVNAPMGSLFGSQAMGLHKACKGSTWCDCNHEVPKEDNRG